MYLIRADKMKHDWYELGVQKNYHYENCYNILCW